MKWMLAVAVLLLAALFAGCGSPAVPSGPCSDAAVVDVRMVTNLGNLTIRTDPAHAPCTVVNFLAYVDSGYYKQLTFHRVAPNFVVQGGGFESDYKTRHTALAPIALEATTEAPNKQWTLSMARTSAPDSATSEFFINLKDNTNLDPNPQSEGYAVFAHLLDGQDTIDAMLKVPKGASFSAGGYYPKDPIVILDAFRVTA